MTACHITIVDDSEDLRFLIGHLLEREFGIGSLSFSSLEEVVRNATDVLKSHVILLDINLGSGRPDGVAVHDWLRDMAFPGRILFLTGHAQGSPFVARAAETGVPILEKPMSPDELVGLLRDAVIEEQGESSA